MMKETCETVDRETIIQRAILAALGNVKIDYRSPLKMDKAAGEIARYVDAALTEARFR